MDSVIKSGALQAVPTANGIYEIRLNQGYDAQTRRQQYQYVGRVPMSGDKRYTEKMTTITGALVAHDDDLNVVLKSVFQRYAMTAISDLGNDITNTFNQISTDGDRLLPDLIALLRSKADDMTRYLPNPASVPLN